jgi:CO/xanthine dehydrogenase Mo-binding subunit
VTFEVTPTSVTAVAEIGKAIHPMMAIGQIEGGTAQGIGYALTEEVVMKDGRMTNAQLTNYIIPTPMDAVPMDIGIMERLICGAGAKGVGESRSTARRRRVNALRHCGFDIHSILPRQNE